jgi:signal transduction histidine kinase/DNA-binding response OmpR family regulator
MQPHAASSAGPPTSERPAFLHEAELELSHLREAEARTRATLEDDLRLAKQAAEQARVAKAELLASVSHEIRTPLNAILGVADLLWESELSDEQRQYLNLFRRAGENLLVLVNDLLDLSKVEAGQLELEKVTFDVRDVVARALESTSAAAHEKGLSAVGRVSPEVRGALSGDPARLRQVLIGLLSNAVRLTSRGQVLLEVRRDPSSSDPGALLFSVKDTGTGMPPEELAVIFDRPSPSAGPSGRSHGGAGLGLALCRRLVGMMGGHLWAESKLGAGTTVCFTAALSAAPEQSGPPGSAPGAPPAAPGSGAQGSEERPLDILLVEDHPDNRLIVQSYLKSTPHRLTIAEDGEAAVQAFQRGSFHVVLMDMQMPVMDGYEATRRIRALEREQGRKRTPIVALTAHALDEEIERTRQAGCDSYLGKPIVKATLLAALERHASAPSGDEGLLAAVDPDLWDLVPGYIQKRFRDIAACRGHLESGRFDDIRVIAHAMAGSGGAYGFDEITRLGRALQAAAREKDAQGCARTLDELSVYVQRIHAAYGQ